MSKKPSLITGPDGISRCSKCGSTAFARERTTAGKLAAGLLAKKHTKCLGCGAKLD